MNNNETRQPLKAGEELSLVALMSDMSQQLGNIDSRISHLESIFVNNGYQKLHKDFAVLDKLVNTGMTNLRGDFSALTDKLTPILESGLISRIKRVEDSLKDMTLKVESNYEYVEKAKERKWDVSKIVLNILLALILAVMFGIKITLLNG